MNLTAGSSIQGTLPYGRHCLSDQDIQAVVDVLRSDRITQGTMVDRFEEALAAYCGSTYAVAVSSGTAALHLACLATGLGPGKDLITSPITFVASANCALFCGGTPGFVDIDPRTYNLDPDRLEASLASDERGPGIVVPVHFAGQPCDMVRISAIARKHGWMVIEDACHALGATWRDSEGVQHRVGSCSHSDAAVFSFHPVKHMTTGEGGAVLTNDPTFRDRLLSLRSHGITRDPGQMMKDDGPWYYEMQDLGYNYRITDFQCALGLNQLTKVEDWVLRRREIASQYDHAFGDIDEVVTPFQASSTDSAYHLYVLQTTGLQEKNRREVFESLRARGIGTQVHYIPVHLHPFYAKNFGFAEGDFPKAEAYYRRCFSLPIYPAMADEDVHRVVDAVSVVVGSNAGKS